MASNCDDLTLSIFLYLTVRSPIWPYNYWFTIFGEFQAKNLASSSSDLLWSCSGNETANRGTSCVQNSHSIWMHSVTM